MSNHLHLIISAKENNVSGVLGDFKKFTSKQHRAGAGLLTCARPLLVVWRNLNKITMGKLKSAINLG